VFDDGNGMLCCSMMRWRLMRTLCVYISGAWLGGRDGEILWLWALGRDFFVGDWRMILVVVLYGFCSFRLWKKCEREMRCDRLVML
jgi:hypothetical protein